MILSAIALFSIVTSLITVAAVTNTSSETSKEGEKQSIHAIPHDKPFNEWKVVALGNSYTTYSKGLGSNKDNFSKYADPLWSPNRTWWQKKYTESNFPVNPSTDPTLDRIFKQVKKNWSLNEKDASLNWACHKALSVEISKFNKRPHLTKNIQDYCSIQSDLAISIPKDSKTVNTVSKERGHSYSGSLEEFSIDNGSVESQLDHGFGGYSVGHLPSESGISENTFDTIDFEINSSEKTGSLRSESKVKTVKANKLNKLDGKNKKKKELTRRKKLRSKGKSKKPDKEMVIDFSSSLPVSASKVRH